MSAIDLFAPLAPSPAPATCGLCVHRNGPPDARTAGCAVAMKDRSADAAPCSYWFGREQLRAPPYGLGKKR